MVKIPFILRPLTVLLFSAGVLACGSDDDTGSACDDGSDRVCGVCNPVENLAWLRDKIAALENSEEGDEITLYTGTYENRIVIVQGSCCAACLWMPVLWTCDGQRLDESTSMQNIADQKLIWHGSHCQRYD
ncbi:hypothetical protein [Dawidia soli]|uniref:Lipoprotein n=1 Tax=Dawidia soli TaxID=2782352 RepID=A0AAP2D853_9BACT|nr:hypothetical protein [Dawidia soli]MBT1686351.1 hypothetical protein [Dawidia soli]